jgi:hypothetical protein
MKKDSELPSPLVAVEVVDQVYEQLRDMGIDLDEDPLSHGPKRIQQKIAQVRNMMTVVQRYYQVIAQKDHILKRALNASEALLKIGTMELFAHDPEVKQCRSVKDREALAHTKLSKEVREKIRYSAAVFETETLLQALKVKERDLKDTATQLGRQMRLCQDEIGLGRRWGKDEIKGDIPDIEGEEYIVALDVDEVSAELIEDIENQLEIEVTVTDRESSSAPPASLGRAEKNSSPEDLDMESDFIDEKEFDVVDSALGDLDLESFTLPPLQNDFDPESVDSLEEEFWN